jgi:hypothetical protein
MSTLMKENGKTQEEEDVDNLVKKPTQEKMKTIEDPQPKLFSRNTNFERSEQPKKESM